MTSRLEELQSALRQRKIEIVVWRIEAERAQADLDRAKKVITGAQYWVDMIQSEINEISPLGKVGKEYEGEV
jgi:hypothetical protein